LRWAFSFGGLPVTDFKETEMRKMCRYCRSRLPTPTSNEREGFCARGCYNSFYLHRCLVCEKAIERTTANRKICKRSTCRNALAAGQGFGRYHAKSTKTTQVSQNLEPRQKPAAAEAILSASDTVFRVHTAYAERPWRMVAGRLTPNQYHGAVVSDAPDGGLPDVPYVRVWADGDWQATENRNRKLLEKHAAKLAAKAAAAPMPSTMAIDARRVAALVAAIPDEVFHRSLDRRPPPALKEAA
jgi:hypothetical protein